MTITSATESKYEAELKTIEAQIRRLDSEREELTTRQAKLLKFFAALAEVEPSSGAGTIASRQTDDLPREDIFEGRQRIPSTDYVASVVVGSRRKWTRAQIHAGFRDKYGIPTMWENPDQAINNAIARAVKNKMIQEENGLYFE